MQGNRAHNEKERSKANERVKICLSFSSKEQKAEQLTD